MGDKAGIGAGFQNNAGGDSSFIGAGCLNTTNTFGFVGSGLCNQNFGCSNLIGTGLCNTICSFNGTILNGCCNSISTCNYYSHIEGGICNLIQTDGTGLACNSSILGGVQNRICNSCNTSFNSILGGCCNLIQGGTQHAIINSQKICINDKSSCRNTIIGADCSYIAAAASRNIILGGGSLNVITNSGYSGIVSSSQSCIFDSVFSIINGGSINKICCSPTSSISGKYNTICTSTYSSVSGYYNTISGGYSTFLLGANSYSCSPFSLTTGNKSRNTRYAQRVHSNYSWGGLSGEGQHIENVLYALTQDNTPTEMFLDGAFATKRIVLEPNSTLLLNVLTLGYDISGKIASSQRYVVIQNNSGVTSIIHQANISQHFDLVAQNITISADNTNDSLKVVVTGISGRTYRWVSYVWGTEIAYLT
jgi:hypothetical protein